MQTGEANYLGWIGHVVDRLEQVPQLTCRRHPEQAGAVGLAVVEQPVRNPLRQADQIAGRGIGGLAIEHEIEAALEDVDELVLRRMDVRRHAGAWRQ